MSVINTNIGALYSQNAMKTNSRAMNTVMEQLSTGTRVNSAKDDAAGLAIGQNMTSQIRGLNQSVRNLNDGINMMQTAEGAMVEQSNMLQRMRELAVQSMNGTYSDVQRGYMDQEFQALSTQTNKIALDTNWNGQTLLNATSLGIPRVPGTAVSTAFTPAAATALGGTLAAGTITAAGKPVGAVTLTTQVAYAAGTTAAVSASGSELTISGLTAGSTYTIKSTTTNAGSITLLATGVDNTDAAAFAAAYNALGSSASTQFTAAGNVLTSSGTIGTSTLALTAVRTAAQVAAGVSPELASIALSSSASTSNAAGFTLNAGTLGTQASGGTAYNGQQIAVAINAALSAAGSTATVSANATTGVITPTAAIALGLGATATSEAEAASNQLAASTAFGLTNAQLGTSAVAGSFTYQAGMAAGQTVAVVIGNMTTAGLFSGTNPDIKTVAAATSTLSTVSTSLETINSQRASIGAAINRMAYAADNLTNISSNTTQSRSNIMDTDYAFATTQLAKAQIIQQAATAMLAQANQQPQSVMALLKG